MMVRRLLAAALVACLLACPIGCCCVDGSPNWPGGPAATAYAGSPMGPSDYGPGACGTCGAQDGCGCKHGKHCGPIWRVLLMSGWLGPCYGNCRYGCGEMYLGSYPSDPPNVCQPCDCYGNWVGPGGYWGGQTVLQAPYGTPGPQPHYAGPVGPAPHYAGPPVRSGPQPYYAGERIYEADGSPAMIPGQPWEQSHGRRPAMGRPYVVGPIHTSDRVAGPARPARPHSVAKSVRTTRPTTRRTAAHSTVRASAPDVDEPDALGESEETAKLLSASEPEGAGHSGSAAGSAEAGKASPVFSALKLVPAKSASSSSTAGQWRPRRNF